jgi:excisionase family DNA binding protein
MSIALSEPDEAGRRSNIRGPVIPNPNPPLRLKQAADYLGVSVKTLRRYIKGGRIAAIRLGPQALAVRQKVLEEFLSAAA